MLGKVQMDMDMMEIISTKLRIYSILFTYKNQEIIKNMIIMESMEAILTVSVVTKINPITLTMKTLI